MATPETARRRHASVSAVLCGTFPAPSSAEKWPKAIGLRAPMHRCCIACRRVRVSGACVGDLAIESRRKPRLECDEKTKNQKWPGLRRADNCRRTVAKRPSARATGLPLRSQ